MRQFPDTPHYTKTQKETKSTLTLHDLRHLL
jgi:hypothetical protein